MGTEIDSSWENERLKDRIAQLEAELAECEIEFEQASALLDDALRSIHVVEDERDACKKVDFREMREMLRAMQAGELTVSRGIEILEMWSAGNWNDAMLPPVRQDLIEEDSMPVEIIDRLKAERDAIAAIVERQREALEYAYENRDTRHEYDSKYDSNCCGVQFGKPCDCHVVPVEKTLSDALALDTTQATAILAERDAEVIRRVIEVADERRNAFAKIYDERVKSGTSEMNGNMNWARLDGAVAVVMALRRMANELVKQ